MLTKALHRLPLVLVLAWLLVSAPGIQAAPTLEVVVEDPQLHPAYTTCPGSYWYPFANNRGHTAYLTLNAHNPANSSNMGEWHPTLPQSGYYRVEAYIAAHGPITWCNDKGWVIQHDTADARYSIYYANGVSSRSLSQNGLSNQWLDLGEYYFNSGSSGYVSLTDLNGEVDFSTSVSFSAMRFTFTRSFNPYTYLPVIKNSNPSSPPTPDVGVIQAQGFDACVLPTVAKMQTWWNESPYYFYGLYLGGIHLPTLCSGVDAAWVSAVHAQGWSFVPTWVGPQAPCSAYKYKMNADPAVSYQEGRQEADAASARAAALGLTNYGLGGTIIYYDMEVFSGASTACRAAASSFMNGWSERLNELGNYAGGYGASSSYIRDWATIAHVPADVWAASWYASNYDPYASVNGISWLQDLWVNHQRLRQYAGDHNERWGLIEMTIDSDVADGAVAMPYVTSLSQPVVTSGPSIQDTGWLTSDQGWLISNHSLYLTGDHGRSWVDVTPAPAQMAYFLPSGEGWALSTVLDDQLYFFQTSDQGATWQNLPFATPPGAWFPLQMHFTTSKAGWVVLRKQTSQAFNIGIMMKTSDGGLSWQTSDLPAAATVDFTSQSEGWLSYSAANELYHTLDGGATWQAVPSSQHTFATITPPTGMILSSQATNNLAWAVTSNATCSGAKGSPGFACRADYQLQQTSNAGQSWQVIALPSTSSPAP
jgi:Rv2525c-like, glycoside hydrolase-like domain